MFNKKIVMNKSGSLAILVPLQTFEALPFISRVHKGLVMNDTGQKKKKKKKKLVGAFLNNWSYWPGGHLKETVLRGSTK